MQSLYYRRDRGDMIECYKLTHDIYDIDPIVIRDEDTSRRGHSLKLKISASNKDIRHNYFSLRVVSKWNSLPESVIAAPSLNSFKRRLDIHWKEYKFCQIPLPSCKLVETVTEYQNELENVEKA